MNIGAEVAGFLVRLVQLGIAASEEQAKEMILAHLRASPPDIAKTYFDARGSVMDHARSDADELELRQRRMRDETLGVTPHRDTVPAPPDTLRILDPHDHDDGEG